MKIKKIVVGNQLKSICLFNANVYVGNDTCKKCKFNAKTGTNYVDCTKIDIMVDAVNDVLLEDNHEFKLSKDKYTQEKSSIDLLKKQNNL